jgi:hypothetical protein
MDRAFRWSWGLHVDGGMAATVALHEPPYFPATYPKEPPAAGVSAEVSK